MIGKMLRKDPKKRPCIEEIIYSDTFQAKAQQNQISLPIYLNKAKLKMQFQLGKIDQIGLTARQLKLLAFETLNDPNMLSQS
jgi:hypothetical protein